MGATSNGLAFVGSQDGDVTELKQFYPEAVLVDSKAQVNDYRVQLEEYLQGVRKEFTIKQDITGTSFQEAVWQQVAQIPYGQVSNYTKIAQAINRPQAIRAVGTAIGKNPLLMVIPCHRVLTKTGKLGGYRGGLQMKQTLLNLEK
ncbi:methylated DNA-protein cysteine methyltransferase [Companilactobacillus kimchiensis]|uniref:methylated-DNA--[protein]-cysteine S-methyltransferase n=1 Tax=Companilactobacillus kimchiensis TaxID=993692 RepID=A0A0R2LFG9_9LACO|nr:methylated DNA-protein cysteine methyltransferase [Companilactobacillus kimchiensis]